MVSAASLEISLRIGQRVRHSDYKGKRVTGVVRGLSVDGDDVLHADIALDDAIVLPPINDDDHELRIYRQHVPAHELAPFDEREELIGKMTAALRSARLILERCGPHLQGVDQECCGNYEPGDGGEYMGQREVVPVCCGQAIDLSDHIANELGVIDAVIAKATGAQT